MARTKNTARNVPYELPRATMAEHLRAITTPTDKENLEVEEKESRPPAKAKGCQVTNVELVASLDINPPESEPETIPNPNAGLHTPVFSEITELNLTPVFQNEALNRDVLGVIMLNNTDHPLAFSPTYFSPTLQSLANSPTVEVPMNPVTVLLPVHPLEVGPTNNELVAQSDIKCLEGINTENDNVNYKIPKKSSANTTEYVGPYRSNPNFTRGKKLSTRNNIQTSFRNDQIAVAKKKVTKRVDRSGRR